MEVTSFYKSAFFNPKILFKMNDQNDTKMAEKNTPAVTENKQVSTVKPTASERFTNMVMAEFGTEVSKVDLTNFQRKLCQNYFIKLDQTLKDAEKKRLATNEQYREPLAYAWENVNMQKLAVDVVCYSAVGLDPVQPNHINIIPYKNSLSQKYDIGFLMGYKGIEIKAKKYGFDVPDDVVVEIVYSTDKFKQIKKDLNNPIETYTFEIVNDFERGEIIGGFYYHDYKQNPEKNKMRVFTKADILKRMPAKAAAEFWGGEKDEYKNGVKTGNKLKVEGWFYEMAYKTIYKAAYNIITIDSQKIDDSYVQVIKRDAELIENKVADEILANANRENLDFEEAELVEDEEILDLKEEESPTPAEGNQQKIDGPGF